MAHKKTSALHIIWRKLRYPERTAAIEIIQRRISALPKKSDDKNPFQAIVWVCIASFMAMIVILAITTS